MTSYASVLEMIQDIVDDESFIKEFKEELRKRKVAKYLFIVRNSKGVSQSEMAKHLNCSEEYIENLEGGLDEDIRLGDLKGYFNVLFEDNKYV